MQRQVDTISAIATPPGTGGLGIVRVSGPAVAAIAEQLLGELPAPRHATLTAFRGSQGELIDSGIALYFPGPRSFTGEEVLELHGHGGPVVLQQLLRRVLELGARLARPGEFSERAFLNDKIDLVQAEAIADLIESGTEAAARAALRSLQGEFSSRVQALQEHLTGLRVFVEAAIDFPDEEIDFLADSDVLQQVTDTERELGELLDSARQGRLLRDGIVLAIIGRPNAGKSSLLNALSGEDTAIVTEFPGTTRDVLRTQIDLDGLPVHLADTAGIRDTADAIEAEGVRRARRALESADVVLLVVDAAQQQDEAELAAEVPGHAHCLRVLNKIDLLPAENPGASGEGADTVRISALTGLGMGELRHRIRELAGAAGEVRGTFSARQRHIDALQRAGRHLAAGRTVMQETEAAELLAEELRLSQQALGEVTGEVLSDDLLGEIFSSFCIGK